MRPGAQDGEVLRREQAADLTLHILSRIAVELRNAPQLAVFRGILGEQRFNRHLQRDCDAMQQRDGDIALAALQPREIAGRHARNLGQNPAGQLLELALVADTRRDPALQRLRLVKVGG